MRCQFHCCTWQTLYSGWTSFFFVFAWRFSTVFFPFLSFGWNILIGKISLFGLVSVSLKMNNADYVLCIWFYFQIELFPRVPLLKHSNWNAHSPSRIEKQLKIDIAQKKQQKNKRNNNVAWTRLVWPVWWFSFSPAQKFCCVFLLFRFNFWDSSVPIRWMQVDLKSCCTIPMLCNSSAKDIKSELISSCCHIWWNEYIFLSLRFVFFLESGTFFRFQCH